MLDSIFDRFMSFLDDILYVYLDLIKRGFIKLVVIWDIRKTNDYFKEWRKMVIKI